MMREVRVQVKNIFKNADADAFKIAFTNMMVELINQIEKSKNCIPIIK